ncbi:DUF3179 domain-containing protein [Spartinivicinus poritis]|uniref:DUF3179 domain-containing protein n=1 Tax=Spartinivicinus poritis TaxID=2994640 RepID=A0ABT5UGG1_9GAMM|nr:DUF3179 domain-containing protein [Spartinivicinus sp. A2-2]MDE1465443.1 DUF3179 domain-containing protein [Spartinivicinus sp. A2-2]
MRYLSLVYTLSSLLLSTLLSQILAAESHWLSNNGFNLTNSTIPAEKIFHGGPPRDGIPAIDQPQFVKAAQAQAFLKPEDRVLGVTINGHSKAYPIKILNYHEIVNDTINRQPVTITYCPLCGTGMVFSAEVAGQALTFGVSGLLYNSDVLLYDRETESLWSQILSKAITGHYREQTLKRLPVSHTTWEEWQQRYPHSLVLSTKTGYQRQYQRSPYGNYDSIRDVFFPVTASSNRYHPKELVLGIEINGQHKAFPFVELDKYLRQNKLTTLDTQLNQQPITIRFNLTHRTANAFAANGKEIPTVIAYWFAWYAFYPSTAVFQAEGQTN